MALAAALLACVIPQTASANGLHDVASAPGTAPPSSTPSRGHELGYSPTPSTTEPYATCKPEPPGIAVCLSISPPQGVPQIYEGGGEEVGGFTPSELRSAYKILETGGSGQTVAIVDAWDDPRAESDLEKYRNAYKLGACTESNKCFEKVNQEGKREKYPEANNEWDVEISLDLDMVSAMCPGCHIRLVEANSASESNLLAAEDKAAELTGTAGATTEISDSWTVNNKGEFSGETSDDTYFKHPKIPITVAAGDIPYKIFYPAASQYVISVGGTYLKKAKSGWEQTVWGDTSGGCSLYESKPTWQTDWSCAKRTDNDVAADAELGISIYDNGWTVQGGTSAAAPIVAGIEAHASTAVKEEPGAEAFYSHALFDVTLGSTGLCGDTYLCTAEEGYDGPTGWGTPDGPLELSAGFHSVTGEATSVTETEARLNGYVNPEGLATTYHFEYGQTTSYGKSIPVPNESVGSGVAWKAVSQSVSGLEQDRTYHYRLVATNSSGTIDGQDHTFATIPWTIQSTPKPTETTEATYDGYLYGVSCSSATACTGVGWYINSSNAYVALADRWNGTEWTVQSTPTLTGDKEIELRGVSCTSSTACTAVGHYISSSTEVTLAEQWNGEKWSIQSTPTPEGAKGSGLSGVSCTSSAACIAVGSYYSKLKEGFSPEYVPLAEQWNGEKWSIQSTPTPEGAKYTELRGVSCTSAEACTAVGTLTNSSRKSVALRWNGKEWSSQEMPTTASMASVSCTSTEVCTVVGGTLTAERWNGKEWSAQSMPNPIGPKESDLYGGSSALDGVSCSSSTQCVAVGSLEREDENTTMAEVWNGTEWSVQGASRPSNGVLHGVSCPSGTACTSVGSEFGYAFEEGYHHFVTLAEYATLPPTSKPSVETKAATSITTTGAQLNGTVNPEGLETKYYFEYGIEKEKYEHKTAEASAGFYRSKLEESAAITGLTLGTTYHFRIVATNADGTTDGEDGTFTTPLWSLQTFPSASGAKWSVPRRVSCVSSSECTAVGVYENSSNVEVTLAERWNGTEWATQSTPNPTGAKWSALAGVSCISSSSTVCTAVGRYENSSNVEVTLAERWNGTEWAIQSTPNPTGAKSSWLEDVSCTSSTACTAVGRYENSSNVEVTLAERWNGTEWAIQSTPNPTGAKWSRLADVSCASSTVCIAVGSYENSSGVRVALAESWNGGEWLIQSTPSPTGAEWSLLKGVSCVSASECTAVGGYKASSKSVTLAERWKGGEWSIQPTPEPNVGELLDVSCASTSWCAATGTNEAKEPLAEHWNGSEWAIQSTSIPSGASVSALEGVSCTTTCFTVGYAYEEVKNPSALAESYPLRPPYAKTEPATTTGETQATLKGVVNPSGTETKYYFEYGPTTSYGTKTAEVSIGSSMSNLEESKTITGISPETTYHFRIVAENSKGTTDGRDLTFATGTSGELNGMAVTDPFNGSTSAISNFASNWSALGWASGSPAMGEDRSSGWGPSATYPTVNGAYYIPTVTNVGSGVADIATMSENPSLESRYFSLWLDMSSPSGTRSGYELTFTDVSSGTYEVKLSKWVSGTQTVLASKSSYAFANGDSFALADQGSTVSAWTNTGSGFSQLLSASDSTFEGGNAGVEGAGNITRLTNFKVGELLAPAENMNAAIKSLPVNDSFATSESPLSDGGAFAALAWDNSASGHNTGRVEGGWGPDDGYPTINGAYWQKTSFADTGAGDAVASALTAGPANISRYFALWLNMPNPASARSGYELRFTETSSGVYEVDLSKWVSGVETVLASKSSYSLPTKSQFSLVDSAGTVSAWTDTASEYAQLLSASDSTYTSGYTGIEGAGNNERLTEFRSGPLPPS